MNEIKIKQLFFCLIGTLCKLLIQSIYFNFLGFSHFRCSQLEGYGPDTIGVYFSDDKINRCKAGEVRLVRDMYIKNYYALVVVFLMTLIRFIFIGKHIWQRP